MWEGDESGQPSQAPEGGMPSVGPRRGGGKYLMGVGPNGWMDGDDVGVKGEMRMMWFCWWPGRRWPTAGMKVMEDRSLN